ncbi:MAG: site-2 protease family protein [Bacillota bacterium]|nr:site-2 protease family protein [Bacillota bacterium]
MDLDLRSILLDKVLLIPAIFIAFTFHEYAHALVADRLGDKTPRFQGRLTLNPLVHTDIIGFILFLVVGFGYAKPVQTNPSAYKHYYKDDLKVSAAGPIANLVVAFIFALLTGVMLKLTTNNSFSSNMILDVVFKILLNVVYLNCILFLFNLIPLPGFDGFHILRDLFPKAFYNIEGTLYQYQIFILLIFIMPIIGGNSIASLIVGKPAYLLTNFLLSIIH